MAKNGTKGNDKDTIGKGKRTASSRARTIPTTTRNTTSNKRAATDKNTFDAWKDSANINIINDITPRPDWNATTISSINKSKSTTATSKTNNRSNTITNPPGNSKNTTSNKKNSSPTTNKSKTTAITLPASVSKNTGVEVGTGCFDQSSSSTEYSDSCDYDDSGYDSEMDSYGYNDGYNSDYLDDDIPDYGCHRGCGCSGRSDRYFEDLYRRMTLRNSDLDFGGNYDYSDNFPSSSSREGMSKIELSALPTFTYRGQTQREIRTAEPVSKCTICMSEFQTGDTLIRLEGCGHKFHAECIKEWFVRARDCPICRGKVENVPILIN